MKKRDAELAENDAIGLAMKKYVIYVYLKITYLIIIRNFFVKCYNLDELNSN